MHTFHIEKRSLPIALDGQTHTAAASLIEFVIDGRSLSDWLNLERGPDNSECDLDAEMQQRLPAATERAIRALQARRPAINNLGSGRVVLYRCHCGSDDCGVVSVQVLDTGDTIEWRDVGVESGTAMHTDPGNARLARLVFRKAEYLAEFRRIVPWLD